MFRMVARLSRRARTMPRRSPFDERDSGALHRHVGAGAHGDADLRLGQGRGVVDAVAGHRHHAPLGLEPPDYFALLVGQHLGPDIVDAERAARRPRR